MEFFSQRLSPARRAVLLKRIGRVIDGEHFIGGPDVETFEKRLTSYFGMTAVSCNSGTDALALGLRALEIGPGDEVVTTAFTYFATIEAIAAVGARPVPVDIERATFNIDPKLIEAAVTPKTKAVLVVHLYGLACDMRLIVALCRKRGLKLIEDCAQSFGAHGQDGKLTGTYGDVGCFSFFPTKNLGGFGDGGAVTVRSTAVAEKFRLLKNHGQPRKYEHAVIGVNSRLDALQAAILDVKMGWLESDLRLRQKNAAAWIRKLQKRPDVLQLPDQPGHTYNVFSLLVRDREAFAAEMKKAGVPTFIYYPMPVYRQRAYRDLFGPQAPLPNAEFAAAHVISLPIH